MAAVGPEAVVDLDGQLPRGSDDEAADFAFLFVGMRCKQKLQDGYGKRCRFSGSRLGTAQQVGSPEYNGNGLFLNGGRHRIPFLLQGSEYRFNNVQ